MRGIDYSRNLAEKRNEFKKNLDEIRTNNKKELYQKEKSYQDSLELKDKAHLQSKYKMENDVQENLNRVTKNTKNIVQENKDRFKERLDDVKNDFFQERNDNKTKFNEKLNNLNESYQRAFDRENKDHNDIQDSVNKNFVDRLRESERKHTDQLNHLSEMSKDQDVKNREKFSNLSKDLVTTHQVEKEELRKSETEKRLQALGQKDKIFREQQALNNQELEGIKKNFTEMTSDRDNNYHSLLDSQKDIFTKNINRLNEQNEQDLDKEKKRNLNQLREAERDGFKEKEKLNRRLIMSGVVGSDSSKNKIQEQLRKKNFSDKLDRNQQILNQSRNEIEENANEARKEYLANLKKEKLLQSTEMAKVLKSNSDDLAILHDQHSTGVQKLNQEFQSQQKDLGNALDSRNTLNVNKLEKKNIQQGKIYNQQMEDIVQKNAQEIHDILDENRHKIKSLYLNNQMEKNELRQELEENFRKKNDNISQAGQSRVENIQRSLDQNRKQAEFIKNKLQEQSIRDGMHQNTLLEEIQKENRSSTQDLVAKKDSMYSKKIEEMKKNYENWINEIRNKSDEKLKEVISKYDNMLIQKETEFFHKTKRIENTFKREQDRLKQDYLIREGNIKVQYEDKLNLQKDNYEERIDHLKKRTL